MATFYFTYGTEGQPFYGGWTKIIAPNREIACKVFRAFHPDRTDGLLNCCDVYDYEHFRKTEMAQRGNFGHRCHEVISLQHELLAGKEK